MGPYTMQGVKPGQNGHHDIEFSSWMSDKIEGDMLVVGSYMITVLVSNHSTELTVAARSAERP